MLYNQQYYNTLQYWENVALQDIHVLKKTLHSPYGISEDFSPTPSAVLSLNNRQLNILDFACGIGRNLPLFRKVGNIVDGYDLPQMITRCKQEGAIYDSLYDNWSLCRNNEYDLISDIFSLQFFSDPQALCDYLNDIAQISDYFHIITRNYIEDKHYNNIIQLLHKLNLFDCVDSTVDFQDFINRKYPTTIYGEFLFKSKIYNRLRSIRSVPCFTSFTHCTESSLSCEYKSKKIKLVKDDSIDMFDDDHVDIAFIDSLTHNISGSKYYNRMLMFLLLELGYHVKWYYDSDGSDLLSKNFYPYVGHQIHNSILYTLSGNLNTLDVPYASCYFGTSSEGALKAIELGAKYHRPVYIVVYDCPSWISDQKLQEKIESLKDQFLIEQFFNGKKTEYAFYTEIKDQLHQKYSLIPQIKIITLTENSIDDWRQFFELPEECFISITPCVNSRINNNIQTTKQKRIIVINRNCWNKGLNESIEVFYPFSNEYVLDIITDTFYFLPECISRNSVNNNRVILHTNLGDADKFILLKRASLLISNSYFEGFGMWAIESLACGTPVICYDHKSLKDIQHPHLHKIPRFDKESFKKCMNDVLLNNQSFQPVDIYNFDNQIDNIRYKIDIPINSITSFTTNTHKTYNIETKFCTKPVVFHFNSIYNTRTCKHTDGSIRCWNKILNAVQNNQDKFHISDHLHTFTFSNKPLKTILELSCDLQNIPLTKLGTDIKFWQHNDRIKYIIEYLKQINHEFVLHVDSLDAVIYGNISRILDNNLDNRILFNAEEVCHPESQIIEKKQAERVKYGIFRFLNGGVFFGRRVNVIKIFELALQYTKYESPNPMCDDCDQGKLNQVYIDRPDLIELDSSCNFFYCNDYKTEADRWLLIS